MVFSFTFFFNSILLGVGLAMDAFSVSLANGLNEPEMKPLRMNLIAGVYGFFQFLMPMIGWFCVHTLVEKFNSFSRFIPWIALVLLLYIGGEMLLEGLKKTKEDDESKENGNNELRAGKLAVQGIATSIDALSVGFTIENYSLPTAVIASLIIAAVTHVICLFGLKIGKTAGTKLGNKASVLGGIILIGIGIEIFVKGIFF